MKSSKKQKIKIVKDIGNLETAARLLAKTNKGLKRGGILTGFSSKISQCETIGLLVFSGFEILEDKIINSSYCFVAKKVKKAGNLRQLKKEKRLLFAQKRIGKNGQKIKIYKIRTMSPFASFAQKYLYQREGFGKMGKPENDFRVTPWGKFLRKYWIDELPQIINLFKGEMKLVGFRPLTPNFFKVLPKDLQEQRIKYLPGLIPQCYADQPKNLPQRIASERKYLKELAKNGWKTDLLYFLKALLAIIRGERGH